MYGTYIIYSKSLDRYYIGSTSDFSSRLEKHLYNHKGYTGRAKDWDYVYQHSFEKKEKALAHEKAIKKWISRKRIEALINSDKNQIVG